jgi:hypothetical protein
MFAHNSPVKIPSAIPQFFSDIFALPKSSRRPGSAHVVSGVAADGKQRRLGSARIA